MTHHIDNVARELADRLMGDGIAVVRSAGEKRLFLLTSAYMAMNEPGIMIALEDVGCHFWDGTREINAFRLISSGFDMDTSATLAAVLNIVKEEMTTFDTTNRSTTDITINEPGEDQ